MEELDLGALSESGTGKEVSEKDKQKVQEDSKKAKQVYKSIKKDQAHNYNIALFLSKILKKYYHNDKIISKLFTMVENINIYIDNLHIIFSPFINGKTPQSITEYIDYLKKIMLIKII